MKVDIAIKENNFTNSNNIIGEFKKRKINELNHVTL